MSESTNSTAILSFEGATPSKLIKQSSAFAMIGTNYVKAAKVLAVAAVLSGAPVDDVQSRTGLAAGAIKRPVAIVRNGDKGNAKRTAAKVSAAMHRIDYVALLGDDSDARYDAVLVAGQVWDEFLSESTGQTAKRDPNAAPSVEELAKFAKRLRRGDLAILIHDTLTLHSDELDVWTVAIEDAVATAAATIESAPAEDAAA